MNRNCRCVACVLVCVCVCVRACICAYTQKLRDVLAESMYVCVHACGFMRACLVQVLVCWWSVRLYHPGGWVHTCVRAPGAFLCFPLMFKQSDIYLYTYM